MDASFLHTPTMFTLTLAVSLSLAVLLAWIGARRHRELMLWSAAMALNGITFLLYALRGQVSDLLSVVLANALLMLTYVLLSEGLHRFRGSRPPRLQLWGTLGVPLLIFPMLLDAFAARVVLGAAAGLFLLGHALLALRAVTPAVLVHSRGRSIFGLGILLTMLVYVLRGGYALAHPDQIQSLSASGTVQGFSFALAILCCLLQALGAIVMIAERSEAELRDTERIRRFRNQILEMVSHGKPLEQTLETLVRGAQALRPGVLCGLRLGGPLDAPNLPPIDDVARHPAWKSLREQALAAGLSHLIVRPVRDSDERLLGALAVHHGGGRAVTSDELDSIEQMTRLAGLAIERDRWTRQLQTQAMHDSLTGLPNRRLLTDHLALAVAGNARSGRRAALIFLDLDNFKVLNDRHGHQAGDQLLIQAGARLRACVREGDTVARFGGDEFVVLLADLDTDAALARDTAVRLARRISTALAEPYQLELPDAPPIPEQHCPASIGVHLIDAGDSSALETLLDRADHAMYVAKKLGGGAVHFSDEAERAAPGSAAASLEPERTSTPKQPDPREPGDAQPLALPGG